MPTQTSNPMIHGRSPQNIAELCHLVLCGNKNSGKSPLFQRLKPQIAPPLRAHESYLGIADSSQELLNAQIILEKNMGTQCLPSYLRFDTQGEFGLEGILVSAVCRENLSPQALVSLVSRAQVAIIVIDATIGFDPYANYMSYMLNLLGIKEVIFAVNKVDLVDYQSQIFEDICQQITNGTNKFHFISVCFIPISAVDGENIQIRASSMPWYKGPTIIGHLRSLPQLRSHLDKTLQPPIQLIKKNGVVDTADSVIKDLLKIDTANDQYSSFQEELELLSI